MAADPKGGKRIVDPAAVRSALLQFNWCAACGVIASNAHHVIQKGSPHFGDDVAGNIVGLCGTGTMRCHGAMHGSPYVVARAREWPIDDSLLDRRDQQWVARRIGHDIQEHRPDVVAYVIGKLGDVPGWDFLSRTYYMAVRPVSESPKP